MQTIKRVLLILAMGAVLIWLMSMAQLGHYRNTEWWGSQGTPSITMLTMDPCPTEDAPGPCYWNAAVQGNGEGRSFTVDATQHVTYWDGKE